MISGLVDSLFGETKQDVSGRLSPMFQQYAGEATFKPYTVRSTGGAVSYDPTSGVTQSQLSPGAQQLIESAGTGALGMFGQLEQFRPDARAREIYNQQASLLQPEFEKQNLALKNALLGSGRGGLMLGASAVGEGASGGMVNPDVYNTQLAQNRALAELAAGSRTQALGEASTMGQIGSGLLSSALGISDLELRLMQQGVDAQTARAAAAYGAGQLALTPQIQELAGGRSGMDIANLIATGMGAYTGAGGTFGGGGGAISTAPGFSSMGPLA